MTVLTLLLCLVTAFGFTACGDKDNGGGGGGSGTGITLGTAIQQVATATLREQNLNIVADVSAKTGGKSADVQANFYMKKVTAGYDFMAELSNTVEAPSVPSPSYAVEDTKATHVENVKLYYLDGILLVGLQGEDNTVSYRTAEYVGTFDDYLSMTDMPITMQSLPGMLEQIKNVGGDVEKKNGKYAVAIDEDLTNDGKDLIAWLKANLNKPIGEAIAVKLGKTAAQVESDLANVFAAGQKVSGLVAKVDAFLQNYGFTQSVKQMIDSVQSMTEMTTEEIVALVKENMQPNMAAQMPAVTAGQTLYDYFMATFGEVNVDELVAAFTSQPTATLKTVFDNMVKPVLFGASAKTLSQVVNMALTRLGMGNITAEMLADLSINAVKLGLTLDTDTSDRLTKLKVVFKVDIGVTGESEKLVDLDYDIDLTLSYNADNAAKIAFPADAEIAPMIMEIDDRSIDAETARQTGYTLNVYPGFNTEKVLTVPQIVAYGQDNVTMMPNAAGEYTIEGNSDVLATFKDNKIVLKKEIFDIVDLQSVSIEVAIDGESRTWFYLYVNNTITAD